MVFNKRKLVFISAIFILTGFIILWFVFCSKNTNAVILENEPIPTDFYITEEEQQEMVKEEIKKAVIIGKRIKALSNIPDIDETIFKINGYPVTRRQYETELIKDEVGGSFEAVQKTIDSFVRKYAIKSEDERLNIKPLQQDIDNYMEQTKYSLENRNEGTEILITQIEAMGMSQEEYLIECEKMVYGIFQREALRKYLESEKGITDFDKYFDELAEKANIEFLDPKIEKLYNE